MQTGLLARLVTLLQQFLDVVGILDVLSAVIAAQMGGDEFFMVIEQQLVGIDFEGELL